MGSDHTPVMCTLAFNKDFRQDPAETELRFNLTRADWALFGSELDGMITEINCKSLDDINSFDEIFSNIVNVSASKAIPKCTATTLKSYPRPIVILIKARQALRKKKKKKERTNSEELKILNTEFNKLTRQIKVAIKKYTEDRWANFLGKLGPYPASSSIFWSIINRARTQKKGSGIPTLIQDGKIYETDKDKANLFASILSKTYSESGEECNEFDKNCYNYVEDFVSKLDYSDDQFSKVSFLELVNIIDRLKIDSSPGEDGIHNRFLKKLSFKAVNLLLDMINLSLCVGMPEAWKVAVITMIPKKTENSTDPNDYRGISLLSCLGKLAERVIKNRLYSFLESKKLIIDEQSGFRTNRGTSDNLLFMTQKIQERLNKHNGSKVCGIFFDISKAFDKVWHAGLIYKLVYLGVPMYLVRFVKNFLSKRFFKVRINNKFSKLYPITCSVPQGSVLGPLLFLVFIGDIPLSNSKHSSYSAIFADDLGSIFYFKKSGKIAKIIEKYLVRLMNWLSLWRLKMNASKCCYTIFSGAGRGKVSLDLKLFGELIPYNPNPLFLGVRFDEYLCFNKHFQNLRVRALKRLNVIKIFSHSSWHLSKATLTNIFRALIGSLFDYSFFSVACIAETNLKLVQTVQNRAIRIIYKLKWDSPTKDLFPVSKVLFIRARFLQMGARYILKCFSHGNRFIKLLVEEYSGSWSENSAKASVTSTPVGAFYSIIRIAYACIVLIRLYLIINFFKIRNHYRIQRLLLLCKIKKLCILFTVILSFLSH